MVPNPAIGVLFHWLGGLASGSFYVPFRAVKRWSWETYWLVGGFFSWIVAPWVLAAVMTSDLAAVLRQTQHSTLGWCYLFGALWGIGGLTFGLTMRYLGMSLGMAVALGYCAAFGTLIPPIFRGEFLTSVLGTSSGRVILFGIGVCLSGIAVAGLAGVSKERELPEEQKRAAIKEFNLKKGILVATFSGIMSACMSYGLAAGQPIRALTLAHGTSTLWQGLPVLVVVLLGGFTTNLIWCLILHVRNHSGHEYYMTTATSPVHGRQDETILETAIDAPGEEMAAQIAVASQPGVRVPVLANYFFSALAGTTWYFQFFFYTMGETQMGAYGFSSWTLHMASIIIFSTLWGLVLHEWRGSSPRTIRLVWLGVTLLVLSTIVVGYGNYLGTRS
jgi:L-rhamnose-H+ transport protein